MRHFRDRPRSGAHQNIEIDEAVALALVIGGDVGAQRKCVAHLGGGKIPYRAADVNPRPQHHVLHQRLVAKAQHDAGMREAFAHMQEGEWAGPAQVAGGWRLLQLVHRTFDTTPFEQLPADLRQTLSSDTYQLARDQRFAQYSDSLERALRPQLVPENLRWVPWPVPRTLDVGS